jgi:hypothetical protein
MNLKMKSILVYFISALILAAFSFFAVYLYNNITIYETGADFGIDPVVRFKHQFGLEFDTLNKTRPNFAFMAFTNADGDVQVPYAMEINLIEYDSSKIIISKIFSDSTVEGYPLKSRIRNSIYLDTIHNDDLFNTVKNQIIISNPWKLKWPTMNKAKSCIGCGSHGFYIVDKYKSNLVYWDNSLTFSPGQNHKNIMSLFENDKIFRKTENQLIKEMKETSK